MNTNDNDVHTKGIAYRFQFRLSTLFQSTLLLSDRFLAAWTAGTELVAMDAAHHHVDGSFDCSILATDSVLRIRVRKKAAHTGRCILFTCRRIIGTTSDKQAVSFLTLHGLNVIKKGEIPPPFLLHNTTSFNHSQTAPRSPFSIRPIGQLS